MTRRNSSLCLMALLSSFCVGAEAASVALVTGPGDSGPAAQTAADSGATVLTFGNQSVVISESPLSLPGGQLLAADVAPSALFIVRDRRPLSERSGYDALFSHSGFTLAVVADPEPLAAAEHVSIASVSGSMVVIAEVPRERAMAVPDPKVQAVLNKLRASQYQQYLTALAQNIPTRYSCSTGQVTAREAIRTHFKKFGLATRLGTFTNRCGAGCKSSTGYNVIGTKQGLVRPQAYYLVGAHYDSISGNPCQSAPGANDNASGVAAVMELARVFSQFNTEASVIFVAFGGEELGLLGSQQYVQDLVRSGLKPQLKAFVVLDMISYYNKNRGVLIEGSSGTTGQSAAIKRLSSYAATYTTLKIETTTNYGDSDHEPFLDNRMAGALLIESDWSKYAYYHTVKDQLAYQNFAYGLEMSKVAAALLAKEAKATPVP